MSMIMTKDGWRNLQPLYRGPGCYDYPLAREPVHVPGLLETMGVQSDPEHKVAEQYCQAIKRNTQYTRDHPWFIDEQQMLSVMSSKNVIPGFLIAQFDKRR